MAEEEFNKNSEMNLDDAEALRAVLHEVRGISPVSTSLAYIPVEDEPES